MDDGKEDDSLNVKDAMSKDDVDDEINRNMENVDTAAFFGSQSQPSQSINENDDFNEGITNLVDDREVLGEEETEKVYMKINGINVEWNQIDSSELDDEQMFEYERIGRENGLLVSEDEDDSDEDDDF